MTSKGSVRQRHKKTCPPGSHKCHGPWYWMIDLGVDPTTRRRRRKSRSGFATKSAAEASLATFVERQGITQGRSEGMTVSSWLDMWLRSRHNASPTTLARYEGIIRLHLKPILGHILLVNLTPEDIDDLIARVSRPDYEPMERNGHRWKHRQGLSSASVNRIFDALRASLTVAAKRRLITWNPAAIVEVPDEVNQSGIAWSPREVAAFLDHVWQHRLYAMWHLLLVSGTRRGELCGLKWEYLDLDRGIWYVTETRVQVGGTVYEKAPKSKAGTRKVYLDQETIQVLRAHAVRQKEDRLAAGPAWTESGYVFTTRTGTPLTPEAVSRTWSNLVTKSGLPEARLHDGRHTANSTAAFYANVADQVLIERVGHTRVTTNRAYQHPNEENHRSAAEAIAAQYRPYRGATEFPTPTPQDSVVVEMHPSDKREGRRAHERDAVPARGLQPTSSQSPAGASTSSHANEQVDSSPTPQPTWRQGHPQAKDERSLLWG